MPGRGFTTDKEMQADIALNSTSDVFLSTLHLLNLRNLDSRKAKLSKRRQSQALQKRENLAIEKACVLKISTQMLEIGKQWDGLQAVPTSTQIRAAVADYMESQGLGLALCVLSSLLNQSLTEIKTWSFGL